MAKPLIDTRDIENLDTLLLSARKFVRSLGVTSASYRLVPAFHSQLDKGADLFHFGFPDAWVALYDGDLEFRRHDPIADYVIRVGKLMTWAEAIKDQKLTLEQTAFVQSMNEHGLIHGWAAPFYGRNGREAYVTFSFGREVTDEDAKPLQALISYTADFHNKIINLTERQWDGIDCLSKRENEVLEWVARGKSNTDIASILGVAPSTVGTLMRRTFRKLDVNDRMAATLKGLERGIVRL